ncbi:MAG: HK97 gp10 family phage protein [Clostridia bacterium]|nr:HK97 gp10 family phage protein [Clostridia bacterium]
MAEIEGLDSLMDKLDQLGDMDSVMLKAVRKQAEVVRAAAVRLAPTYAGDWDFVPRGELRNSIHTTAEKEDEGTYTGTVYSDAEFAMYVEFGTGPMGQGSHADASPNVAVSYRQDGWVWPDPDGGFHKTQGMPAQSFMYPALKNMESRVVTGLKEDLQAEVKKIGGS